ncbi:glycosyltransferase [Micromonospora sp. KC207]|uniref:glycosyltransferase family 4 protein n=1 Tax=Micromonospora sp. KC207 TaxID=2530377 RepID=UPI001043AE52|nr:glycosyltransferase [Micromonospora sp. KC207]TDC66491.1 glycosyltransferase [Micromonospora sp. KC207]
MRVVVTTEYRYAMTPDGRVWTTHAHGYDIWRRYLTAFDEVRVVARVAAAPQEPKTALRVDGPGVTVHPVPHYVGPQQYLRQRVPIGRAMATAAERDDAVILRVPSALGSLLAGVRRRHGLPYALEVVGDPYDVLAPGVVRHPLRPLLRQRFATRLRRECGSAVAVSYVTADYLQARYPAAPHAPTANVSSIDLPPEAFAPGPRAVRAGSGRGHTLISIGTLDQLYKGVDTLVEAVAVLVSSGVDVRLVHAGDGRFAGHLKGLAGARGVADRVTFAGWVAPGAPLRARLDAADLAVMPSRTEGLPRALIEAMARALPAIGTAVGGIPELLSPEDLVRPDDPDALAGAIAGMLADPDRMTVASARNLARARRYSRDFLEPRRHAFYQSVREATDRR